MNKMLNIIIFGLIGWVFILNVYIIIERNKIVNLIESITDLIESIVESLSEDVRRN